MTKNYMETFESKDKQHTTHLVITTNYANKILNALVYKETDPVVGFHSQNAILDFLCSGCADECGIDDQEDLLDRLREIVDMTVYVPEDKNDMSVEFFADKRFFGSDELSIVEIEVEIDRDNNIVGFTVSGDGSELPVQPRTIEAIDEFEKKLRFSPFLKKRQLCNRLRELVSGKKYEYPKTDGDAGIFDFFVEANTENKSYIVYFEGKQYFHKFDDFIPENAEMEAVLAAVNRTIKEGTQIGIDTARISYYRNAVTSALNGKTDTPARKKYAALMQQMKEESGINVILEKRNFARIK